MGDRIPWLEYLVNHIGLKEIPGPQHEPVIVAWGREAGIDWWNNDDDAWCAVALNAALVRSGFPSTRSALARSFTTYGTRLSKPVRGAIVVFPRGRNPLYGHAGFVDTVHDDGTMTVVSGNLSNRVKRAKVPDRCASSRRDPLAAGRRASEGRGRSGQGRRARRPDTGARGVGSRCRRPSA